MAIWLSRVLISDDFLEICISAQEPKPRNSMLCIRSSYRFPHSKITCFIAILTSPVAARGSRRLRYQGCLWCPPTARLERWREFEPMTRA
ncbi:hypothetical protein HZ326_0580 [Fusarium oxysporum f. sp. albedinis]|nr:hypothetical protein HZ326_0580 [Fusarium oxysporum f. sp. albedinis]